MNRSLNISLAALVGFDIGLYLCRRSSSGSFLCDCEGIEQSQTPKAPKVNPPLTTATIRPQTFGKNFKTKALKKDLSIKPLSPKANRVMTIDPDLARYGTAQGVIEVAKKLTARQKQRRLADGLNIQAALTRQQFLNAKATEFKNKGYSVSTSDDLYGQLQNDTEKTQITITNNGDRTREVQLWGSADDEAISPPDPFDIQDHLLDAATAIEGAVHPQGMAYNPFNGYTYIANQLSDNVSVISADGKLVKLIPLTGNQHPGVISPVDLTVNTNPDHEQYGQVYVIGMVSGKLMIIDTDLNKTEELGIGCRPTAIAFNPVNNLVYVSYFLEDMVLAFNMRIPTFRQIIVGHSPRGMAINTHTGHIYVANSADDNVTVYDSNNNGVRIINTQGQQPVTLAYHPAAQALYVSHDTSNETVIFDTQDFTEVARLPFATTDYGMAYSPLNEMMYLISKQDSTIKAVDANYRLLALPSLEVKSDSLAIDTKVFAVKTASINSPIANSIGLSASTGDIVIDEDYSLKKKEFQMNPIRLTGVNFYFTGGIPFNTLYLKERSITGKQNAEKVSMANNLSPQHNQNMVTLPALTGKPLDGHQQWCFALPPKASLTMILEYNQIDNYYLIPQKQISSL